MNILFNSFLILHIVSGTLGLISGSINIIGKKGGTLHRRVGKVFLFSMLSVSCSAFVLSVIHPNYFLFIVGVFTLYLVGSGTRYLYLKQINADQKPGAIDWVLTYFMLVFGIAFILFGAYHLYIKQIFGFVFIVFGTIGLRMVRTDFKNFRGKSEIANVWLTTHIQRMIGAYIAALTAFLVVNNQILPAVVAWLLPTFIFLPVIIKYTRKYQSKMVK